MVADRNLEIEFGVVRVGLRLAQVPLHAAGAQHRPGHAERDGVGGGNHANIFRALQPDAVGGQQRFVFVDLGRKEGQEILDVLFEAGVSLVLAAADAEGMRRQARAAIFFENLQDLFPVAEGVKQRRHRSDIERVRAQPKLVAGNALQFRQDHANILRARRRFHVHQFFDRFAVAEPIRHGGAIVHAVDVGIEHRVGAVLGNFFHAAVQVSDDALGAENFFAVELQNDAQHAVRRRMLRPHINDEFVRIEIGLVGSFEIEVRDERSGRVLLSSLGARSLSALDSEVDLHPLFVLLQNAVILAQRVAFPAVGQKDALQIGMPVELDAEHVVDFALQPIGGRPDRDAGRRSKRRRQSASSRAPAHCAQKNRGSRRRRIAFRASDNARR